jgi:hypothetical protein
MSRGDPAEGRMIHPVTPSIAQCRTDHREWQRHPDVYKSAARE